MRVIHVITRLIVGGAQENTLASVLGLRLIPGVDVTLVSGPSDGPEGSLEPEARQVPGLLRVMPDLVRPVRPLTDVQALIALARQFRTEKPDIVHTHSGKAGLLGRLAASLAGVPLIVHTIHGPSFGTFQGALPNAAFRAAERLAGLCTTHFVVVAHAMTRQYLAAGIGVASQYTRILSGFSLAPFLNAKPSPEVRSRLGLTPSNIVVGKIARLFELKGHDDLIDVAPHLIQDVPEIRFLLVGDGEWRARLEGRIQSAGLGPYFKLTGLVPPSQVPEYVAAMDILAHLSRREGLARALPQALAAGRPVIAYDCDGANEICLNGRTGYLINPGDLGTLRERLRRLAKNPALRLEFGQTGREMVREGFTVERMVSDLYALYRRLMSGTAGSLAAPRSGPHPPAFRRRSDS
ncbi:MAG: glycosyltransferase family 4 protein [Verrucomicrobiales bacterium]|nr:glycosyltransferase family 4 protein [Verrucomicrobiales bacterium]